MRAAALDAEIEADIRGHMVHLDIRDAIGRDCAGRRRPARREEGRARPKPRRSLRSCVRHRDPRAPAGDPALDHEGGHHGGGRRAERVALDLADPGPGELDGPAEPHRHDRGLLDRRGLQLAAVTAADEGGIERDLPLAQPGRPRGGGAGQFRRHDGRPDFEPVAGQPRGRGQRLDGGARHRRDPIGLRNRARSGLVLVDRALSECAGGRAGIERAIQHSGDVGARRRVGRAFEARVHRIDRLAGGPAVDRRDADPAGIFEQFERAEHRAARIAVEPDQPAAARRHADARIDHAGEAHVAREHRAAVDLRRGVEPRQRLPGKPVLDIAAHRQVVGNGPARGRFGKLGEGDALAAAPHEAAMGVERAPVAAPSFGRRHAQKRARRRPGFAKRRLEHPDRRRSAGRHQRAARRIFARRPAIDPEGGGKGARRRRLLGQNEIGIERVDRRRLDRDGSPVRAELVGKDLRQAGIDALARFRLRHRDDDPPVPADLQEGVEQLLARAGLEIGAIAARPRRPGQRKPDSRAAADQQRAPADPACVPIARHPPPDRGGSRKRLVPARAGHGLP